MSQQGTLGTPGRTISQVKKESAAWKLGLRPGDRLLAINRHSLRDIIDYRFYAAEPELNLDVMVQDSLKHLHVAKDDADLGLEFDSILFDGVRRCVNNCPFCFVKGLPLGLRSSLYLKDDDYRLSFLQGNFITLTNLDEHDWQRLAEQRLSPLYISVHTTDQPLRQRMLDNPHIPAIMDQLARLRQLRIQAHCQVVLCPGVNDGVHLEQTVHDLASLYPTILSVAVVPVGLSRPLLEQQNSPFTSPITPTMVKAVVRQVTPWQRRFRTHLGCTFVHLADELYLKAGRPLPSAKHYDGFAQYENGVGMVRTLLDDWTRVRRRWRQRGAPRFSEPLHITLACGLLIAPILQHLVSQLDQVENLHTSVVPVADRLFGPSVTVSGLLSGTDIVEALKDRDLGSLVVISKDALNSTGQLFLDDLTPGDLERRLGTRVSFANSLSEVIQLLDSGNRQPKNRSSLVR